MIKITRSFNRKISLGDYEMADFFASRELEVEEKDATQTSKNLHDLCELDVIDSMNKFIKERNEKRVDITLGEQWQKENAKRSEIDEINSEIPF